MDRLIALLQGQEADFEIIRHERSFHTAKEGAEALGIGLGQTAPSLIVKTETGFCAVMLSGASGRLDMKRLQPILGVQQVKLASPSEVEELTGSKPGDVGLIQPGLPTVVDKALLRYPYIFGGTGIPDTTLKIRPEDAVRLNRVVGYLEE
ncbi:MAG: hypothetical protein K0Q90_630 [Paenibacillaceae bacterium]|jgi:prolyl-tRNA editing enzyme YbaK/EbsC (Cys-tRNA(Pro) deacylase)|nr:hypothetical protein [Paenibacillaceae bacterium]